MEDITEIIQKFLEVKHKLSDLEKKHEKYRKNIEEYMTLNELLKIENGNTIIKKTLSSRETVCKKDIPLETWQKYCKTSRFTIITVTSKK